MTRDENAIALVERRRAGKPAIPPPKRCTKCFAWGHTSAECRLTDADVEQIKERMRRELKSGGCCGPPG